VNRVPPRRDNPRAIAPTKLLAMHEMTHAFCTCQYRLICYLCTPFLENNLSTTTEVMTNRYETVFILTPVLSEDQAKEAVDKFTKLLKDGGSKIHHTEDWGLRKLAYPIQKKSTGFYHLLEFEAEGPMINDLEVAFRRDERVLRFLTVKLDKHAVIYNEKKRSKKSEVIA
jgi:small subunit ribosomal protein S6